MATRNRGVRRPGGRFPTRPETRWLEDGRLMTLITPFSFVDDAGVTWTAPADTRIDGASIPKPFWSLVGGPYEGKYRDASVVHDAECIAPYKHRWQDVHRMFYAACLAGGVKPRKALLLYMAVYLFGPHWDWPAITVGRAPRCTEDDATRAVAWLRARPRATHEDVEALTVEGLRRVVGARELAAEHRRLAPRRDAKGAARLIRDSLLDD
jgi:hypothetical protein